MPEAPAAAPAAPAAPPAPAAPDPSVAPPSAPETPPTDSLIHDPSAPPSAPPPSITNPDGTFVPDWADKLPEEEFGDFRSKLALYKNPVELAKALKHAHILTGKKGIIPPTAESTPEEWSNYRKTMGVPETVDGYAQELKPSVEVPEGIQWNDDIANQYFELAHRHNIPASAMKEMVQLNLKQREFELQAVKNQVVERKQDGLKQLRQLWGANFDRNLDLTRRAASRYGVDVNDAGWNSVEMVKAWARAMQDMGEDKFVGPGSSLPSGSADFKQKAKDIQTNPDNPYHKKYWAGDPDVQRMVREYLRKSDA